MKNNLRKWFSVLGVLGLLVGSLTSWAPPALATITTTTNQVVALGNGVTTTFSYNFIIPNASQAVVIYTDASGVATTLTPSQYTITGLNNSAGGTVTYPTVGAPIASGTTLTIQRIVTYVQTTSIANQGPTFRAIENALDYLTMQTQQLANATAPLGFSDGTFFIYNSADSTKKAYFSAGSIATGTTRTFTFPDANTIIVGTDTTQTLTNKTLTSPVISGGTIDNNIIGGGTPAAGTFTTLTASSIVNTGSETATAFIPSGASVPTNGLFLPAANSPGMAANGVEVARFTSTGINNAAIGATTASTGAFTTLSATSTVSGAGITALFASPPAIGGTSAAAGTFTALTATGAVALSPANNNVVLSPTGTGVVTINPATAGTINNVSIGGTTRGAGSFTTLNANGAATLSSGGTLTGTFTGGTFSGITLSGTTTLPGSGAISSTGQIGIGVSPSYSIEVVAGSNGVMGWFRGRSSDNTGQMSFSNNSAGTEYFRISTTAPQSSLLSINGGVLTLGTTVEQVRINHTASATNYLTLTGSNGGNPTIGVSGGKVAVSAALVLSQTTLLETSATLTNGAGASTGTLLNAPSAGNPTKWIPINDNGATRYIPAW